MPFDGNLTDIWYGNEIEVAIGWYNGTAWQYEVIEYRQGFNPEVPDNTEGVYDGLTYKGDKRIQIEKTIDLSQTFRGFGIGLDKFENLSGMIVRSTIVPDGGTIPAEVNDTRYYTNYTTSASNLDDIPNQGEFNVNLSGRFDERQTSEPTTSETWIIDNSANLA